MGVGMMQNALEIAPAYRIAWHVSPLDENPEIHEFAFWHELEDWVQEKENNVDCFDITLCHIESL
jgi:hypothetical protein